MTNRPILALLTIALFAVPCAPDAAAKEYFSYYRQTSGLQTMVHQQSFSEWKSSFDSAMSAGLRVTDINIHRNAAGAVRYDTVFKAVPLTGSYSCWVGLSLAEVMDKYQSGAALGMRMNSLSSCLDEDGTRRYAMSMIWVGPGGWNSPHVFMVDINEANFVQQYAGLTAGGYRLDVVDTFLDPNGERRFHAVYNAGTGNHAMKVGMTFDEFQNEMAAKLPLRTVKTFETYVDPDGVQRYLAVWEQTWPSSTKFFASQSASEFSITYANETSNGYELIDMENLTHTTPSWSNYGAGLAGTNGVPELTLGADPYLGQTVDIAIGNSSGAPALCGFFAGLSPASLPFAGGNLLVNPAASFYFPLPPGGVTLPVTMPFNAAFSELEVYGQIAQQDLGAPEGISLSRGLKMTFGRLE